MIRKGQLLRILAQLDKHFVAGGIGDYPIVVAKLDSIFHEPVRE